MHLEYLLWHNIKLRTFNMSTHFYQYVKLLKEILPLCQFHRWWGPSIIRPILWTWFEHPVQFTQSRISHHLRFIIFSFLLFLAFESIKSLCWLYCPSINLVIWLSSSVSTGLMWMGNHMITLYSKLYSEGGKVRKKSLEIDVSCYRHWRRSPWASGGLHELI